MSIFDSIGRWLSEIGGGPRAAGERHTDDDEDLDELQKELLPPTSPAFTAHFTDPIYDDLGDEFAPFGNDEGATFLFDFPAERLSALHQGSTLSDVLDYHTMDLDHLDEADVVIAAGFILLRVTGQIDPAGKQALLHAFDTRIAAVDSPVLRLQRDDVATFPASEE